MTRPDAEVGPATVLRANFFMSNPFAAAEAIAQGQLALPPATPGSPWSTLATSPPRQWSCSPQPGHDGRTYG